MVENRPQRTFTIDMEVAFIHVNPSLSYFVARTASQNTAVGYRVFLCSRRW